jgi:hypothetical protein
MKKYLLPLFVLIFINAISQTQPDLTYFPSIKSIKLFQQNNQGNYIQTTFWVENTNINFHNVTNNDQDFTRLLNAGTVQTQMNNGSRLSSSFTNQEKEEYIARGSLIKGKADNEVNEHKQEIEKLNKEINDK